MKFKGTTDKNVKELCVSCLPPEPAPFWWNMFDKKEVIASTRKRKTNDSSEYGAGHVTKAKHRANPPDTEMVMYLQALDVSAFTSKQGREGSIRDSLLKSAQNGEDMEVALSLLFSFYKSFKDFTKLAADFALIETENTEAAFVHSFLVKFNLIK